jgi:hypothetical protein
MPPNILGVGLKNDMEELHMNCNLDNDLRTPISLISFTHASGVTTTILMIPATPDEANDDADTNDDDDTTDSTILQTSGHATFATATCVSCGSAPQYKVVWHTSGTPDLWFCK